MKKASLPLNYVFIVFVSVIAVFVIVGMISKWALNSSKFMCKLTGDCDEKVMLDKQTISVSSTGDNSRFIVEIIKHAKLCYERAKAGEVKGELCYTVKCDNCQATPSDIQARLQNTDWEEKIDLSEFDNSNKAIIEFDYYEEKVRIK